MTLSFLLFGLAVVLHQTPDLNRLQWHSRVLLLFAKDSSDQRLAEQKLTLEQVASDLTDRDLRVYEVSGPNEPAQSLRTRFHIREQDFAVVLIGKDGSSKVHCLEIVAPAELFRLIDSMPMRGDEMARRK